MLFEISINDSTEARARYLTWAPSPCSIRITDAQGAVLPPKVMLRHGAASAGRLVFHDQPAQAASPTTILTVPLNGDPVPFRMAGEFGQASNADRDTILEIVGEDGAVLASVELMIRVRKDANRLSPDERDRFVAAFAQLNQRGQGPFRQFREMHTRRASAEAHFDAGFLPWHRAYLLDLERSLQAIDPSVALPYWRFDQPAPALFDLDFLGVADNNGMVRFSASNPLQFWATDGFTGIERFPLFNTSTESARQPGGAVWSDDLTLTRGDAQGNRYAEFVQLEGQPHGVAHTCFDGFIADIHTAAKDPLFFLLHCNVDRLWAKWQWLFGRFDPDVAESYTPGSRIGHNLPDTMWPWNEVTTAPRPPVAPGGPLASGLTTSAPGPQPTVASTLDFQGRVVAAQRLGYDYDDVPFE